MEKSPRKFSAAPASLTFYVEGNQLR
jgi:hypothetical protein